MKEEDNEESQENNPWEEELKMLKTKRSSAASVVSSALASKGFNVNSRSVIMWCSFWFISNLTITFFNKWCLSGLDISPLINTLAHMSLTFLGCLAVEKGRFTHLASQEFRKMALFSFLFTFNIVFSQVGLKMTTMSLNQVTRAITPLFQATLEYLMMGRVKSRYNLIPLAPVCLGIVLTSLGDLEVTTLGLVVSIFSVFISALKGVLSMKILQQDLREKLQQYSFLVIVTPMSVGWLLMWEGTSYLYSMMFVSPELNNEESIQDGARRLLSSGTDLSEVEGPFGSNIYTYLFLGGCLAFTVNVASLGTVKITSATTMGVMANAKQALTMLLAIYYMEGTPSMLKLMGIITTMFGAVWYTYRKNHPEHGTVVASSVPSPRESTKEYSSDHSDDMDDHHMNEVELGGVKQQR